MSVASRIIRHTKLTFKALSHHERQTPPFMIIFINSICNLTCEHCFYWSSLNKKDDLTFEEFEKLSLELGDFETLNLSGGEPFIRTEFADICSLFVENNGVKQIYVPTNGYFTERTEKQIRKLLKSSRTLERFGCEISLDGMPGYHNTFRGNPQSFEKAMETHDMLAELQKEDARLVIHANICATNENINELWQLIEYLYDRCPAMEHVNLSIIRGDRKNPSLEGPTLQQYKDLYKHITKVWKDREKERFGSIVEPMQQWAKLKTIESESQYVPCKAGILSGVIYANGDVSVCEIHRPLGNLRKQSFFEIWDSEEAKNLKAEIKAKKCYCTTEVFLWPSIVFQPVQLTRAMIGAKVLQHRNSQD